MAVNRQILAQALANATPQGANAQNLQTGQEISKFAMDSSNFGGGQARGIGLAAQLATAGIGAYTQYKAQKDIVEQELSSQAQFSKQFPHLADIASTLSPATREAYTLESLKNTLKASDPASQLDLQSKQLDIQGKTLGLQKTKAEIGKLNKETANVGNTQDKPPAGYKFNPDGSLKAITGGPADKATPEAAKTLGLASEGLGVVKEIRGQFFDPKTGAFDKSKFGKTAAGAKLPNFAASSEAQLFATRSANLADVVGRMRSGGAIGKEEEVTYKGFIPKWGDSEATVKYKIDQLEKGLGNIEQSIKPNKSPAAGKFTSSNGVSYEVSN